MLDVAPQTLRRWRSEAQRGLPLQGPRYLRVGRRSVRYRLSDVRSYLDECLAATDCDS
jgi:predicted DNA-binding transcriptional regulator AlpA